MPPSQPCSINKRSPTHPRTRHRPAHQPAHLLKEPRGAPRLFSCRALLACRLFPTEPCLRAEIPKTLPFAVFLTSPSLWLDRRDQAARGAPGRQTADRHPQADRTKAKWKACSPQPTGFLLACQNPGGLVRGDGNKNTLPAWPFFNQSVLHVPRLILVRGGELVRYVEVLYLRPEAIFVGIKIAEPKILTVTNSPGLHFAAPKNQKHGFPPDVEAGCQNWQIYPLLAKFGFVAGGFWGHFLSRTFLVWPCRAQVFALSGPGWAH